MTLIRARVTKEFPGVEDGKVYPRDIKEGEEISGDLAAEAIKMGVAKETKESRADRASAEASNAEQTSAEQALADAEAAIVAERERIRAGLKTHTRDELIQIAAEGNVDIATLQSDDDIVDALVRAAELKAEKTPS